MAVAAVACANVSRLGPIIFSDDVTQHIAFLRQNGLLALQHSNEHRG